MKFDWNVIYPDFFNNGTRREINTINKIKYGFGNKLRIRRNNEDSGSCILSAPEFTNSLVVGYVDVKIANTTYKINREIIKLPPFDMK